VKLYRDAVDSGLLQMPDALLWFHEIHTRASLPFTRLDRISQKALSEEERYD